MASICLCPHHRNSHCLAIGTSSGSLASLDDFFEPGFLRGRRLVEQREAQETADRVGKNEDKRFVNEKSWNFQLFLICYTKPWAIMVSAIFSKAAMLAPAR